MHSDYRHPVLIAEPVRSACVSASNENLSGPRMVNILLLSFGEIGMQADFSEINEQCRHHYRPLYPLAEPISTGSGRRRKPAGALSRPETAPTLARINLADPAL